MRRIKIEDLPKDYKITNEEMRIIHGGFYFIAYPYPTRPYSPPRYSSEPDPAAIPINIP